MAFGEDWFGWTVLMFIIVVIITIIIKLLIEYPGLAELKCVYKDTGAEQLEEGIEFEYEVCKTKQASEKTKKRKKTKNDASKSRVTTDDPEQCSVISIPSPKEKKTPSKVNCDAYSEEDEDDKDIRINKKTVVIIEHCNEHFPASIEPGGRQM